MVIISTSGKSALLILIPAADINHSGPLLTDFEGMNICLNFSIKDRSFVNPHILIDRQSQVKREGDKALYHPKNESVGNLHSSEAAWPTPAL